MLIRQTFFFLFLFPLILFSTEEPLPLEIEGDAESVAMDYVDATIYGIIEGVTEFLPISSTGHLIIASEVLEKKSSSELKKEAINAYLIVIQGGAILAVALIYRSQVWSMVLGILGMNPSGKKLLINLFSAFLPAAFLGLLLDDLIESYLFGLLPVAIALFAGGLFMAWAEKRKKAMEGSRTNSTEKSLEDLTLRSSLLIGFLQCVAMWPGTSRSMMTIVGGYLVGLSRGQAAEFSFLLGLVTLTAAAAYKGLTKGETLLANLEYGPMFFGCLVAGVAAAFSVRWLVGYLARKGLGLFVWYRLVLGLLILSTCVEF